MRRFYAATAQIENNIVTLDAEETRHLRDVLRLREGASVQIFDGGGKEFRCAVRKIEKQKTLLEIIEKIAPAAPESPLDLTLAVALLKGEKIDLIVQKSVELGVATLVPLATIRADVKLKETEKRLVRWRKIALEAAKQAGRARLMRIETPTNFDDFIETVTGAKILFAERGGAAFSAIEKTARMTAIVGAEGGWETSEIEAARALGFQIVTLGGRILRAETAAISVAAILQNQFGDVN